MTRRLQMSSNIKFVEITLIKKLKFIPAANIQIEPFQVSQQITENGRFTN